MKISTFTALRHRNFRFFFFGQIFSLVGQWMHSTAQGWLVLDMTDSAFYLSLVHSLGYWPILFLSPLGGILADRVMKRNLLVLTQASVMVLSLLLAVLVDTDVVQVWMVAVVAVLIGLVNSFDVPARQSFIIEMVGKDDLMNGIALNASLFHGSRIIGPAIAGFLISAVGIAVCFYLNALSFMFIIFALLMMRFDVTPVKRERRPLMKELGEGFAYVRDSERTRGYIMTVASTSLLVIPYLALMPMFARDILHVGVEGLGFLMGAAGVGAFTGAILLASSGRVRKRGSTAFIAAFSCSVSVLLFSLTDVAWLCYVLIAVAGWGMLTQMATLNTLIQHDVPDDLRGRVMSFYTLVLLGFIPIGNLMVGTLASYVGPQLALTLSTALCIVIQVYILLKKREHVLS